ncbi:unnamed protein product [Mytilus coruscus]|uniref:Ubiquitin-like protease family profile domain-containing protein n=1 Tax=Mytilus coruscus TaxID=42192 RepID=A0A6J8APH8_MYTCO|nr:unnamed protein product [Mytilus coruscus]
MGKYAELQTDILYILTGVAIHHGHYTFIKYDRGIPIKINDEAFSVYSGSYHLTDSYLVHYKLIPKNDDICHRDLPNVIVALMECDGWNYTIDAMQNASGLSVRKKLILELLQQIKIDDITLIHSWKAYKLMQEAIGQIEIFNNTNQQESLINAVLSYMCKNRPILMENNFGLSTVKHTDCAACQNVTTITEHTKRVDIKKYGRTVFIKGSSKILHPDTFSEIITTFTPRAVMSSLFTVLFRQKGRDVEIVQLQSPNNVAEVNMENVITMADQCLHGVLLIADQNDVKECTKQMYQILYDTIYIEPDRTFSVQLTDDDLKLMDGLSTPMLVRGFQLRKEEVVRFLSGEFSDLNIDAFFSTLNVDNSLTIPSSWFAANIGYEQTNKKEGRETWFDKDLIFLPININRNHWLLTVIFPKAGLIYHLDPLGNQPTVDIGNRLCSFLNDRKLFETFNSIEQVWKIDDLMATGKFPLQKSGDSCGAVVCIYGKMIEQNAVLPKGKTDKHIRQYVFHEVIEAYRTEALNNTKFGLQNVMFTPDIDTIVQTIVKGEQTFNTEHHWFLKSPNALYRDKMCNFGGEYVSQDDYFEIAGFLLDKYFWCKKGLFTMNCQQCIFAEADELNRKLKENFQYAPWYVDCVLVKGVLVEILRRSLNSDADDMWSLCKMTEFSVSQAIKNDIKQIRDAKRKEKEDRYQ